MKKRALKIVVMFLLCMITTMVYSYNAEAASKKNSIQVSNVEMTEHNIHVEIKIKSDGKTELIWGEEFSLERLENGGWVKLKMKDGCGWNDIAYTNGNMGGHYQKKMFHVYTLTSLYNRKDLYPGTYRLCMNINLPKKARYAEFEIPEYKEIVLKKNKKGTVDRGTILNLKVKTNKKIKWSSSNKKVAKVTKYGIVTAKNPGKAVIKAKYGKKVLKYRVFVSGKSRIELISTDVDPNQIEVKVKFVNNNNDYLEYGAMYSVERFENNQWVELTPNENYNFDALAYMTTSGCVYKTYCVTSVYDRSLFVSGKYRIKTSVNIDEADRYVEFNID